MKLLIGIVIIFYLTLGIGLSYIVTEESNLFYILLWPVAVLILIVWCLKEGLMNAVRDLKEWLEDVKEDLRD